MILGNQDSISRCRFLKFRLLSKFWYARTIASKCEVNPWQYLTMYSSTNFALALFARVMFVYKSGFECFNPLDRYFSWNNGFSGFLIGIENYALLIHMNYGVKFVFAFCWK